LDDPDESEDNGEEEDELNIDIVSNGSEQLVDVRIQV